ncbi:MAG: hypothetical protein AAFW00_15300 [Bacteroidota bacterium]
MKNWTLLLALLLGTMSFGLAQKTKEEKEFVAIKKVITKETNAFFSRDYDAWASCFLHVPQALQAWSNPDGSYTASVGWELIDLQGRMVIDNSEPLTNLVYRDNFTYRYYGEGAYVTFDQYLGDKDLVQPSKEVRVLEKVDGKWKIICVAAFGDYSDAATQQASNSNR